MIEEELNEKYDILLIEDNSDDVFLTNLAIKECDLKVKLNPINDGKLAMKTIKNIEDKKEKKPDLILLDVNLPKVNGLEVLKFIKSKDFIRSVPVVIFTSSDSYLDMNQSYEIGADLYVLKPNNITSYKGAIQYIVGYTLGKQEVSPKRPIL